MYTNPETLNTQSHAGLTFSPIVDFSFARNQVVAPLAAGELGEASKHFPVAFAGAGPVRLIGLVGVNGQCSFVQPDGSWRPGAYVPAFFRAYPFAIGASTDQAQSAVVIERSAPQFNQPDGQPLFDAQGQPTSALQKAREFLMALQQAAVRGEALLKLLADADVLVPMTIRAPGNQPAGLPAIRVVDPARVAALTDAALLAWARNGLLSLITLHRNSLSNSGFGQSTSA